MNLREHLQLHASSEQFLCIYYLDKVVHKFMQSLNRPTCTACVTNYYPTIEVTCITLRH